MSASFKGPEMGDKSLNLDLSTAAEMRISSVSSCDESDDTGVNSSWFENTSWSSWRSVRNRRTTRKQYSIVTNNSYGTIIHDANVLDKSLKLPPIQELTINQTPEDEEAMPKIEDLKLDSDCESATINKIAELSLNADHKPLAGVVTSVAKAIGLVVVKPPMPHDVLLYLGSPVFIQKSSMDLGSKDVKLGWIIDVFGPACEPYYCVKPVKNGIELVHEGTQLFYSPDHPRTAFLCLKREDGNRYTVLCSLRCPKNRDHRKGQQLDSKDFWKDVSGGDSFDRQSYRRRYRDINPETYRYKNKYQKNHRSFRPNQPKHLYFDY